MSTAAPTARLRPVWLAGAVLAALITTTVALTIGPASIGAGAALTEVADRLLPGTFDSGLTDVQKSVVWNLRFPRVVLGLLVGGSLAVSGAAYQGVFRNPLADPYLLGIAAGAGFGATLVFVSGTGDGVGAFDLTRVAAFLGALAAVGLTWAVGAVGGRKSGRRLRTPNSVTLILAGVAVASFFTALQTYVQQLDDDTISRVYLWILGSLTTRGWDEALTLLPVALACAVVLTATARLMDVLAVGDDEATSLGLKVTQTRLLLIVVASLATAAAVAVSGLIAFVGLIVPHTIRMIFGASNRVVVPLSFFLGGIYLTACDVLARTLMSPAELPIGVVTAFFGAPFFILIMRSSSMSRALS